MSRHTRDADVHEGSRMMVTVDAHLDTLWVRSGMALQATPTVTHETMRAGGLDRGTFVVYISDRWQDSLQEEGVRHEVVKQLEMARADYPGHFVAMEGARLLGVTHPVEVLEEIRSVYPLQYLTLVHNRNNIFASSSTDDPWRVGLTTLGRRLVKACERLGVLVDVSHASDQAFTDVIHVATRPVIASHSGCRTRLPHERNLTDDQIIQIALTNGMVGIPMARRFVGSAEGILDHVEHVLQVTGSALHVGIGSDLDGAVLVDGVRSAADWRRVVVEGLSRRRIANEHIALIAGGNWLRLFTAAEAETGRKITATIAAGPGPGGLTIPAAGGEDPGSPASLGRS